MKAGWQTKCLGDICDVLDYKRKPITKKDRIAGDYPYYGATGILSYVNNYLFDEKLVLVGEDGAKWASGDSTAFSVDGRCWVNNHAHVLRPHRDAVLDNWLIYFLNHSDLSGFVSGLTVPKLNQGNLREISIPLAPIAEQQRIVGILDEAFDGIATAKANAEKNLQNARALFESQLRSAFAELEGRCKSVCLSSVLSEQPRNGWSPPAEYQTGTGHPVLTLSAVTGFEYSGLRVKLSSAPTRENAHYWLKAGELLITRSNTQELVGHVAVYDGTPARAICCDLIMKMSVDPLKADTRFIYFYLRSPAARDYLTGKAHGASATMKKIGKQVVQNALIPVPTLAEQIVIASQLETLIAETKRLESLYQQKLAALAELKKSLLHQAFSGQL